MLFTNNTYSQPKQTINEIKIGNENISHKTSVKFLGLIIDEKLNWHEHIESCKNKISKTLYII